MSVRERLDAQQREWSLEADEALSYLLEATAQRMNVQTLNLSRHMIESAFDRFKAINAEALPRSVAILAQKDTEDILLRACTLLHLNDAIDPLLPLLCSDGCKLPFNHPATMLFPLRSVLFGSLKAIFVSRLSSAFAFNATAPSLLGSRQSGDCSTSRSDGSSALIDHGVPASVTEIDESGSQKDNDGAPGSVMIDTEGTLKEGDKGGGDDNAEANDDIIVTIRPPEIIAEQILCRDSQNFSLVESFYAPCKEPHWQLVIGVQCSFIGQLFTQLEALGQAEESLKESDVEQDHTNNADKVQYVWEEKLRRTCTCSFPFRGLGTQRLGKREGYTDTKAPLIIRRSKDDTSLTPESSTSRLFHLFSSLNDERNSSTRDENDWTLLTAFIEESVSQTQKLIDSFFAKESHVSALSPSRLTILLQFFRALGVVLGLGWRAGISPSLSLPPSFHAVLASPVSSMSESESAAHYVEAATTLDLQITCMAHMLRSGLGSVVPRGAMALLSVEDIEFMLGGAPCLGVDILRKNAVYSHGLNANDLHVNLFWAALAKLPYKELASLLGALFPAEIEGYFDLLCVPLTSQDASLLENLILTLYPPTALAMLCPDTSPITAFPDKSGLSLPKCMSLGAMEERLRDFISSLKM
jgi:hypothetical protein